MIQGIFLYFFIYLYYFIYIARQLLHSWMSNTDSIHIDTDASQMIRKVKQTISSYESKELNDKIDMDKQDTTQQVKFILESSQLLDPKSKKVWFYTL